MSSLHFTPFPTLTTPRFILRELRIDDEMEIFILRTDEAVNQFLDRAKAESIEDVRNFIVRIQDGVAKDAAILWVIELKGSPGLLGTICLWNIAWEDATAEIGYELLPDNQGKGIMQEVMPVVIDYALKMMGLRVIVAGLSAENVKSVRLLEKHGFVKDAGEADEDEVFYTLKK